jgi:hypothetical protein
MVAFEQLCRNVEFWLQIWNNYIATYNLGCSYVFVLLQYMEGYCFVCSLKMQYRVCIGTKFSRCIIFRDRCNCIKNYCNEVFLGCTVMCLSQCLCRRSIWWSDRGSSDPDHSKIQSSTTWFLLRSSPRGPLGDRSPRWSPRGSCCGDLCGATTTADTYCCLDDLVYIFNRSLHMHAYCYIMI